MNKLILLLPVLAVSGFAQSAPDAANPMSTWLRNAYTGNRNNIVRTAEKMPEENYGMRPGAQMEVRTFGQQVADLFEEGFLRGRIGGLSAPRSVPFVDARLQRIAFSQQRTIDRREAMHNAAEPVPKCRRIDA